MLASGRDRRSAAGCEVMSALDIENQRIIDEAIAQNAATSPRTWNGPLLVNGAQRRAEMIAEKMAHVCETPSEREHYLP